VAISVIIPAYNEEQRIGEVIKSVAQYADEVLVIDDGSTDNTANAAKEKGAVVIHQKHSGYLAALKQGFSESKNDILVTMDADGEHRAYDIPRLTAPVISGDADLVLGIRNNVPRMSEKFITRLTNLKIKTGDACTGFRSMKKELALRLKLDGACTCGTLILESYFLGAKSTDIPIKILPIDKPRTISWHHIKQVFYVIGWLIKSMNRREHQ
jgi:glycosyltransferase involved in cell wall biosynthesis